MWFYIQILAFHNYSFLYFQFKSPFSIKFDIKHNPHTQSWRKTHENKKKDSKIIWNIHSLLFQISSIVRDPLKAKTVGNKYMNTRFLAGHNGHTVCNAYLKPGLVQHVTGLDLLLQLNLCNRIKLRQHYGQSALGLGRISGFRNFLTAGSNNHYSFSFFSRSKIGIKTK